MQKIQVEVLVNASLEKVWKAWNDPESIKGWAFASADWECPYAENDLRIGGKFITRMSSKDKSTSFDFTGAYTDVQEFSKINYTMDKSPEEVEARTCEVIFEDAGNGQTKVIEIFDAENINSLEMQKGGWQSILNNFKKFVEMV
jgi:uncharacterized protein YndB with AHSA1/START domain